MAERFVIVGAGHAAGQLAASLRQGGFEGEIVLIGDEPYIPYQRPPLSKKFLAGEIEIDRVYFKPPEFYEEAKVTLRLGETVSVLSASEKTLTLTSGETLSYDKLALTTGSRVRKINCPGSDLEGLHYLRTIDDVEGLREEFKASKKLVIVGAGYIGLEVAAVARQHGLDVLVLEMESRVLARVTSPEMSAFFQEVHRQAGVDIRLETALSAFEGDGRLERVVCGDETFEADLALIGIGIVPNVELAEAAGIACDNGIVVDAFCQTSDANIFAAGDCTNLPSGLYGRRVRLESVHNALEQAKTAAAAMLGTQETYDQVPWFWSDQYDLKLQIAGLAQGYDEVVLRGDPGTRKFAAFYLQGGRLIAVDAINAAPEYMMGRKLIGEKAVVSPERLADTSISMKEVV